MHKTMEKAEMRPRSIWRDGLITSRFLTRRGGGRCVLGIPAALVPDDETDDAGYEEVEDVAMGGLHLLHPLEPA